MSDLKPDRLRRGQKAEKRRVERLHPSVEVRLSPADIEYYRSLGPWAMVLDRQSKRAELTREEATGQANRVRNVLQMARDRRLVLPEPRVNLNRKEGEFQFSFEEDACPYHWFVDGLLGDASGFTASPFARLQLWRAAKMAALLRDHGCAPKAILVGELTRFFRSQRQFLDWYHILKDSGAQVQIYGCPEFTSETEEMLLPMLLGSVSAQSKWLHSQHQMSRQTRKARGELFNTRAPFGLMFNLDKHSPGCRREVFAHPVEWPLLRQLVTRIAASEFSSRGQALVWFVAACEEAAIPGERVPRSHAWLWMLFKSDLLRGVYCQHQYQSTPCRIEDPEMKSDWDHCPSGRRRYIVDKTPADAVSFPILMTPEEEIPFEQLQLARQAFHRPSHRRSKGMEGQDLEGHSHSLLRLGIIYCRVCGHVVLERAPRMTPDRQWNPWTREEDEQLVSLIYQPLTNRQIADAMGFTHDRVNHRRSKLKLRGKDEVGDRARVADHWDRPFGHRFDSWHLDCLCVRRTAYQNARDVTEVRESELAQHCRKRNGSITAALEPLLWEALCQEPRVQKGVPAPRPVANLPLLETEEERINSRIQKVQRGYENEDWAFYTRNEAIVRLSELRQERAQVQAEIAAAKGSLLDQGDLQEAQSWEETRQLLTRMVQHPDFKQNLDLRRRLVDLCVRRIEVDLETGTFEVETNFHAPELRQLCGQVLTDVAQDGSSATSPTPSFSKTKHYILRGHVLLAA